MAGRVPTVGTTSTAGLLVMPIPGLETPLQQWWASVSVHRRRLLVSYSTSASATYNSADSEWCDAGSFTRSTVGMIYFSFSQSITARAIRITASSNGACTDELEVYEARHH